MFLFNVVREQFTTQRADCMTENVVYHCNTEINRNFW